MSCLNYAWFLAAHFHDLGYPVEYHGYLLDFARRVTADFPYLGNVDRASRMTYRSDAPLASLFAWRANLYGNSATGNEDIPALPERSILELLDRRDHALTAAFFLWDRASRQVGGTCFPAPVLRTAALACASHNFQYYVREGCEWFRISLARDPVSFLLHLVDVLQEWSRERVDIDVLWELGMTKHQYARVVLVEPPRVIQDEKNGLVISYCIAIQPFLDSPRMLERTREDSHEQAVTPEISGRLKRIREELEKSIISRARRLTSVLSIDKMPGIVVDGRYLIGTDPWPSSSYEPCFTHLVLGKKDGRGRISFKRLLPFPFPSLQRAVALEVRERQPEAKLSITHEGGLGLNNSKLYNGQISLDPTGKVTITHLRDKTVYLLKGAGGIGKSTLLRHLAATPPSPYDTFYCEVIPSGGREIDFDQTSSRPKRLFLVDHFDHVLARPEAEHWKEEVARLHVPDDAVLILACRTEVADQWPYIKARPDIRILELRREGYMIVDAESFAREKLRKLRPAIRDALADLALRVRGERWMPVERVSSNLLNQADGILRKVDELIRFDHDHVQDSLAALGILRALSRGIDQVNIAEEIVAHPPWVYVFLIWSLCGEVRGVAPFLDIGREAYLRLRRHILDGLLHASRALQWLQHTDGSDLGIKDYDDGRLPIEELEETLVKEATTVDKKHYYLIGKLAARSLFHLYIINPPESEEQAKIMVQIALRYRNLGDSAEKDFETEPFVPIRYWVTRRHNIMMTRAYLWSRRYPNVHREMDFWHNWKPRWEKERILIQNADVEQPVKDYWLAMWMSRRAQMEMASLEYHPIALPLDRKYVIELWDQAIRLYEHGIFYRRRAIEHGTGHAADGYETKAQGLGDQANGYMMIITSCWALLQHVREDPLHIVQRTVEWECQSRRLWDQARAALGLKETLPRFYARCAIGVTYAAAVRALRDNPKRPLHEVEEAAEKAFNDWLKPYPFEAARDLSFEGKFRKAKLEIVLETIQLLESLLRNEARSWAGS